MPRILAFLALLFGAFSAFATTVIPAGTVTMEYVTGGVKLLDGPGAGWFLGRNFANPTSVGGPLAVTEQIGARVGGNELALTVARTVSSASLARSVAAVGAAAWAGCAAGTAIANYAGMGNGTNNGARVSCNVTDWLFDEGQSPQSESGTLYRVMDPCKSSNSGCVKDGSSELFTQWSDAGSACSQYAHSFTTGIGVGTVLNGECSFKVFTSTGQLVTSGTSGFYTKSGTVSKGCPATIDALNPAFSTPAGAPPGPDGLCPTGRYAPIGADIFGDILGRYGDPGSMADVASHVLTSGHPIPDASDFVVSGPSSVPGTPSTSTTTNPDGSTVTTTSTPTTNYKYAGNQITYNTTTVVVTNTCTAAGSCSTTTTGQTKAPEPTDACKENPNSLGCTQLGDPPSDSPTWQTKDINFEPVDLGISGSCPAPDVFSLAGWSWNLDYTMVCNEAPVLALGIQLIAALGAALFVYAALRG